MKNKNINVKMFSKSYGTAMKFWIELSVWLIDWIYNVKHRSFLYELWPCMH